MLTQEIHVVGARAAVAGIRERLFLFSEVLDVLATGREDMLVVVFVGRPRHAEWCEQLRSAGYEPLRKADAMTGRGQPAGGTKTTCPSRCAALGPSAT